MDEKKLREGYETIQIEDGVYRNLVASALRKQREKGGKRRRRIAVMRYALSAASVVLILTGLVMFTARVPFKHTAANATTLESEMETELPMVVPKPTQGIAEAEEDTDENEEFWSVSNLRIVNEYSEQFDDLTDVQREAIFTAFEIMDAQEVYVRDMANLDGMDEIAGYWINACRFFDEKILNVSYQVYPADLETAMNNMDKKTRMRFLVMQNAIEDGVHNGSSFSQSMRYHMFMKYEAQLEDEAAEDSEAGLWGMLEILNMDRAERAIAGLQDGTVVTIEKESGFFYVEYSVFEDDIMLVSSGYVVGNNVWGRLGDGEYINLTDERGLRSRRIYSETQREMYVLEDTGVYQVTSDTGEMFAEICQGDTITELAQIGRLWSCIKVKDTIGYVKSEYLSEWIPATKIADEEILVSAEYEDQVPPTGMTEDSEEYENQIPPTSMTEE